MYMCVLGGGTCFKKIYQINEYIKEILVQKGIELTIFIYLYILTQFPLG